ncbi:MAG: leucyl aminopeptidase family protein [Legionellaceae bacterium]|nr:leucyl aminopeptidase family protein [Legionellaceae bacterium]MBP9775973.1 leucyl aminopeptidase family protein [Legionellaceae bacterium]
MKSQQFYQPISGHAIPLTLLNIAEYKTFQPCSDSERRTLAVMQFGAKIGEMALIWNEEGALSKVYMGAGEASDAVALATAALKLPPGTYQITNAVSERAVLMWALAQYRFDHFQKVLPLPRVLAINPQYLPKVVNKADAVFLVRDLINFPPNLLNPEGLGAVATELAEKYHAQCQILVGEELLTHNYPAIHAVGRAAASAPRLIHLAWGDASHPHVTLVGKGVCFDSGGLDLKNSFSMRLMKKDMGGAAQVLGLAKWLMSEKLPIYLQVFIPAVENAVSEQSYRPGDVLVMRNGMTVEIDNTDAEGRLVLADALVKACEQPPEILIDFATLTGAARVAVGTEISAMFSNNDALAAEVQSYGVQCSDPIWQLPLFQNYQLLFESKIADIMNSSPSAYAGAIVAALFLQYFVKPEINWLHFDIMAWNIGNQPGKPEGGEAMGVLAVGQYLMDKYS